LVERRLAALSAVACLALAACSGSSNDDDSPSIGGINGPAEVDPSFDPFATDRSVPPVTDGG
jgi:hypothetical protein